MKIKYSALVMGVSGKLNGSVGATNKGGAYLRNKGVVSNPNTTAQAAVRSQFGALSSSFRSLTSAQVAAWNTAAADFPVIDRLGDTRYLSGLGLFVQLNTNLLAAGLSSISNPPVKQAFPAIVGVGIDASALGGVFVDINVAVNLGTAVAANEFVLQVKAAPLTSASVTNVKNQLRLIASYPVAAGISIAQSATSEYTARFGAAATVGQKMSIEVYLVSVISGEASAVFKGETLVIAGT